METYSIKSYVQWTDTLISSRHLTLTISKDKLIMT